MFERFTDRARRVVVLAQEEARMLNHNYIGTEHLLLGLIHEGQGVAAKGLHSLGISLEAVRQQVEGIIGRGQRPASGHIPFTIRAKKVLEFSKHEAHQLGHDYVGTEHILLGLIREGEGGAVQVLVGLGADPNRVRLQVIQLLHGYEGKEPAAFWEETPANRVAAWTLAASGERPRPPARHFPADADPPGVVPGHARVDLAFDPSGLLTGSAGGQPFHLNLNVPASDGSAAGTIAGIPLSATWKIASNYHVYPDVPAELTGSFGGELVELHATFHLEPGYFIDHGTVAGHIGAQVLDATVQRASGGLGSSSTVAIDGRLDETEYTIYAAIGGTLSAAKIRGFVAGNSIGIDAERTRQPGGQRTDLTGSFQGPPALLALMAGALLYFI